MADTIDKEFRTDLPGLVAEQRSFFRAGGTRSLEFRKTALRRLEKALVGHTDEILEVLAEDIGKPGLEAYLPEVHFLLTEIRDAIKKMNRRMKPRRVGNPFYFLPARSEVRREPFGVALVFSPWNFPFQLAISPLVAAIAAGNCVILKPSEMSPKTAELISKIVRIAFDPAHATVVLGEAEVASKLLEQSFDFVFYTGSEKIGRIVAKAAADDLTPVVLELGGKCPAIVDRDADLDETAERIAGGKFFNAGQTCIAPDFAAVPNEMREELVAKIKSYLEEWYGEGKKEDFSRIINARHFEHVSKAISGEVIEIGKDEPDACRMAPKVLPKASWDDPSMEEEIFGPVLPVVGYDDIDEVLKRLEGKTPLALYVFSRDKDFQEKVIQAIPSGSVCINDTMKQATNLDLPFGGVGSSGMGRYRGDAGFRAFTYDRPVTRRYFLKDPFARRPPYGDSLKVMRKLMK